MREREIERAFREAEEEAAEWMFTRSEWDTLTEFCATTLKEYSVESDEGYPTWVGAMLVVRITETGLAPREALSVVTAWLAYSARTNAAGTAVVDD